MQIKEAIKFLQHPHLSKNEATRWADFGAGSGLFTHALAQLLMPGSTILAVDKNSNHFDAKISGLAAEVEIVQEDFENLNFTAAKLDGILMANSLHFVADKQDFLKRCERHFKKEPCFLIVEYDLSVPNPWVPYPVDYGSLTRLFSSAGFSFIEKIHEAPSRFGRKNIYSLITRRY